MGSVRGILTGRQSRRTCLRFGQTASDESGRTVAVDDGLVYEFMLPGGGDEDLVTAQAAMAYYERTGQSPLSK